MEYSFQIIDNRDVDPDSDDRALSIEYDAPLTDEGRKEMEYRVGVWCGAVQGAMFADESMLTPERVCRLLQDWLFVKPGNPAFRPDAVCCYLYDAWFGDSEYHGLFKMLEGFNILSQSGGGSSITGLHERNIVRVTIE